MELPEMIKAVFFDLYHTLVHYQPSQEELEAKALKDLGVDISPEALHRPILAANEFIYNEIAARPLSTLSREEQAALYGRYQETVLKEAGIKYDRKLVFSLLKMMQQAKMDLVLFDDVKPALTSLKQQGLVLGLISNIEQDIRGTLTKLGLEPLLAIIVTSQEARANKPQPEIFRFALKQAGVQPGESIYVGDQYQVDVLGSNKAGMKGILLDRGNYYQDISDCPKIKSLIELAGLV
jgi:putative hydrolase of the HAD superfamily